MRIEVFPPGEWAGRVADLWIDRLRSDPGLRMCLPTGVTPRPLYREMAARKPDLSRTEAFVLDEFIGLPPGDPARCDVMFDRDLVSLLDRPPVVRSLDPAAADLDEEAARYEEAISAGGLDLTLLGLGRNGHVGLNEPGSTASERVRVVGLHPTTMRYAAETSAVVPKQGLTLGLGNILESREVWLLVTGSDKAEILVRAVEGPVGPEVPAAYLQTHPNCVLFADEPAAGLLHL
jgi:glucosamine-6-phosphate deaminase